MAVVLFTDRRFERDRLLRDLDDLPDLFFGDPHFLCDLLRPRVASVLLHQLPIHANELIDRFDHVYRNANGARLICDRTRDRLPDPPRRIGGKLISLAVIEFFDRFDQTEVAFLNKIEEQHAAADISLCNRNNQTQVRLRQLVFGLRVAFRHSLGDLDLFRRAEQRHFADLLQVHTDGIVNVDALRRCENALQLRDLLIDVLRHFHLFYDINVERLDMIVQFFDLFLIEFQFLQRVHDLLVGQDALALPGFQEFFDLLRPDLLRGATLLFHLPSLLSVNREAHGSSSVFSA